MGKTTTTATPTTPATVNFYRKNLKQHDDNDRMEPVKREYTLFQDYYSRGLDPSDFM